MLGYGGLPPQGMRSMESSPEFDSENEDIDEEEVLAAAIRTRLPTGSMSPEKERSPDPAYHGNMNVNRNAAVTNGAAHHGDVRIKSEEPSMEEMKATLAALPQKDDPENCTFP